MNLKTENRIALGIIVCIMLVAGNVSTVPVDAADKTSKPLFSNGRRVGDLENAQLLEVSGLAASRRRADVLWAINDGGNGAHVYAVGLDGSDRGRFFLRNAPNTDWEDLASFDWQGRAYLLVADVGDNGADRKNCFLYIVPEPPLKGRHLPADLAVDWAWRVRYVYEDGPRDSESVAVDVTRNKILIVSKRTTPPQLYSLPLAPPEPDAVAVAVKTAPLVTIPAPPREYVRANPIFGRFGSQPTAMDVTADGRWLAVLCYKNAYLYRLTADGDWEGFFSRAPVTVELPDFAQAEAIGFGRGGSALFVTSEKRPAPLWRVDRR